MRDEACKCPVLLAAAEAERMASAGLIRGGGGFSASGAVEAIVIGRMRQEHGCPGVGRFGHCPWSQARLFGHDPWVPDPEVPLLRKSKDVPGQYV